MKKKQILCVALYIVISFFIPVIVTFIMGGVYGAMQGYEHAQMGTELDVEQLTIAVQEFIMGMMGYINGLTYLALGLMAFIMYRTIYIDEYKQIEDKTQFYVKTMMLGIVFFGIKYGVGYLAELANLELETPLNQQLVETMISAQFVISLIAMGIIAPFVEELVFRYIIQNAFMRFGAVIAIIASSIIFAAFHMIGGGLAAFIIYPLMGLMFGIIYYKTKSINTVVGVHIINNVVSIVLSAVLK